jgi:hypothetical protein
MLHLLQIIEQNENLTRGRLIFLVMFGINVDIL